MRDLIASEVEVVSGAAAGDIQVSIGTDGINVSGSLADFADLAVQYSRFAPFSGIGLVGLYIKAIR